VKERVLCLGCLGKLVEKMPVSKRYVLNKYVKRYETNKENEGKALTGLLDR